MNSHKTFIQQSSGYKWNVIAISSLDADRACHIAQREALEKAKEVLKGMPRKDNNWINIDDAIRHIGSLKDSVPDGWKK